MKNPKKNMFAEKFRLLNSQGSVQEISWSSSDSSDYENISSNIDKQCHKSGITRKRKRKQKVLKNLSNLDITFVDIPKDKKKELNMTSNITKTEKERCKSPILCNTQHIPTYSYKKVSTSPILASKAIDIQPKLEKSSKSPIIILKTASPIVSPKVRKKLFDFAFKENEHTHKLQSRCKSTNDCLDGRKSNNNEPDNFVNLNLTYNIKTEKKDIPKENFKIVNSDYYKEKSQSNPHDKFETSKIKLESKGINIKDESFTIQETPEEMGLDESTAMIKTSSKDLANKVKSYFENHFSSENVSQQTISDVPTPKNNSRSSRTSDEIEIINSITQVTSNKNSPESEVELLKCNKKDKKLKYKKDGLAYRLNSLLKKQTASISLWQHERFLAANSDFVIPKGEFKAFRICKINSNYGAYLLEAMDSNDDNFMILINRCFISHDSIKENAILKLYEPYKIMDFRNNCKLVLNVCKFECVEVNN